MVKGDDFIIRFAKVLSTDDETGGFRIKVRLPREDHDASGLDDLPYCFPLLPKHLHIQPKVGETVLILLERQGSSRSNRFYVGPVISQPQFMNYDPFEFSSKSLFQGEQTVNPLPTYKQNPENNGSMPNDEDVALIGRGQTDIILKDNEIRLRAGTKKHPEGKPEHRMVYNSEDMGYVQMKKERATDENNDPYESVINIVADRINLLSYDSKKHFNLNDSDELITKGELKKILEEAHPMVYGDLLVEFLKGIVEVIRTHSHPFSMDPPAFTTPQDKVLSTNLDDMLSKTHKIN